MDFIERLRARASALGRRIAFPEGADPRVRAAALHIAREGIARVALLGAPPDDELRAAGVEVIDARGGDALGFAASLLADGEVDACVAGAVFTSADVLRAGLRVVGLAPGIRTLSSAFYMVGDRGWPGGGVLTFTDCAVVPQPTAEQLADIAIRAAKDRRKLVGDEPVVALLSYSTAGSAEGQSVTLVRDALRLIRDREPALRVDGELQGDAALADEVAARKAPRSPVAGRANVLVFPSLDAGNIAYKLVQRLAGARAIGPILQGVRKPLADLSRGADVEDIINVAAITALQSAAD